MTHDPARLFGSPYTYTGWDPMNLTDPSGAFVGGLIAGIVAVAKIIANYAVRIAVTVGFGTAFGQTLANGGSFGQAFAAGTMGGVTAGIGAYGMGVVGAYVASFGNPLLSYALAAVAIAGSTYQTVESFRSGQYVAGAVGAVVVAFAVASVLAASARLQRSA